MPVSESGSLTPTIVRLLAPHLTAHNLHAVLDAARHKGTREVEIFVANLAPRPDAPAVVRKLPATKTRVATCKPEVTPTLRPSASPAPAPSPAVVPAGAPSLQVALATVGAPSPAPRPPVVAPLSAERCKVQFTVGRETLDKLRRAQDLMRHAVPSGDPAEIFDRALTLLVEHLERAKFGSAQRPRAPRAAVNSSRQIPAIVRREVWARDGGRCAFVGSEGRCPERGFLEFHHVTPYAFGGAATEENIQLRCRAHNQFEAKRFRSAEPVHCVAQGMTNEPIVC